MALSTILPEYPAPPGNKNWVALNKAGPASYTQVATGSPPTGGQTIAAKDHGLLDFDFIMPGCSDDGQYEVDVIFPSNPAAPSQTAILLWKVAATGAQVNASTNLSARTVRLLALGH